MNPEYPFQPQQQPGATPPTGYPPVSSQPQSPQPQQPGFGYQPQPMPTPSPSPVQGRVLSSSKKWLIIAIVFIVTTVVLGGLAVWALVNYYDQKTNVDGKVSNAVAVAVKEEKEKSEQAIIKAAKEPRTQFAGPDDYGRVAFKYPRNWSAYEANEGGQSGAYEAYFSPGVIPPVSEEQRYALRLTIANTDYDQALNEYEQLVTDGSLNSSAVTINGQNGTRLDGAFNENIRGSAIIFKIRDKTVTLRTDAQTFMEDFNALIATIEFNK